MTEVLTLWATELPVVAAVDYFLTAALLGVATSFHATRTPLRYALVLCALWIVVMGIFSFSFVGAVRLLSNLPGYGSLPALLQVLIFLSFGLVAGWSTYLGAKKGARAKS